MRKLTRAAPWWGLLSLALASVIAPPARGQNPESKAQAEVLFREGVKMLMAREYATACKSLEASNKLDPGVGTLLYLADCYEKSGRLASAWVTFGEVASMAKASGQSDREAVARKRAATLEPQLPRVVVMLAPADADRAGLVVRHNGNAIVREVLGTGVPVDPGPHTYEATAPGKKTARVTIEVKPSDSKQTVTLPALEDAPEAPAASSAPAAPPPPVASSAPVSTATTVTPSSLGVRRTVGLVMAGAGVVSLGLGAYLIVRARSQSNDADDLCSDADRTRCTAAGASKGNDARSSANLATVAGTLGAGFLVGGAVLWLLPSSSPTTAGRPRLTPVVGPEHAGLSLGGAW